MTQRLRTLSSLLEDLCSPLSVTPILGNPKPPGHQVCKWCIIIRTGKIPMHTELKGDGKGEEKGEMWTVLFAFSGVSDETNLCRELEHTSL